ncbi:2-mannosyltransferase-like 4 [Durusdinium trenchii]|uniref:2-mannosyltransferase-like 4 n=1 Tax=Durusdinium trenchii TaxID=1381693 RepID=A0ABP0L7V8_9DINO
MVSDVCTWLSEEPGDGYLCPSCPFPWWPLHYPSGRVYHRKGRTLFDPPHGQPRFNDRFLTGLMEQILHRGHKPLRTGFFFNEETGAVFGEESAMDYLAHQLHLCDEEEQPQPISLTQSISIMSASSTPRSAHALGRHLHKSLTLDSAKREVLKEWRPDEDSSYSCILSQHSHLQRLSSSLLMVVLSSFDRMTSIQLCISLLTDKEFVELRNSKEGAVVVMAIVVLVVLYMLIWVKADIDYVGDLVWPTGAPDGVSCERPAKDRLASNLQIRLSLVYFQLFAIPNLVTDVLQLCHPRKGAMKFAALSYRGKIPRFFALGFVNKVMFHFEESVGVLTLLPNMALVKIPCMAFKVYMFVLLQQSGLLLVSLIWDVILNSVKTYKIISHIQTAVKYKRWLADPHSDMTMSARTVREKLLKKHFFFQDSQVPGQLEDPGPMGWFLQLFGGRCCDEPQRSPTGYLGRWTLPDDPKAEDLRCDWVQRSIKLKTAKSMLRCRPGEEIGRKTIWSCGLPSIPAVVVEKLALVNANERVRTEFWYTLSGKVLYEDPRHHSKRTSEEPFLHLEEFVANEINEIENAPVPDEARRLDCNEDDDEDEVFYGRLLTYSTAFYNIAMFNLLVEIVTTKELSGLFDCHILSLFLISRFLWLYISLRRAQRAIVLDWFDKGEYVTNVGCFGRFGLLFSSTIVEMFTLPRMDMYTTQSLHGILSQVPVLLADVALTLGLVWTLETRALHQLMTWLVLVLTVLNFVLKAILLYHYIGARQRYRSWLKVKLQDVGQPDPIMRALKREWRTYFGELAHVLASGPLTLGPNSIGVYQSLSDSAD